MTREKPISAWYCPVCDTGTDECVNRKAHRDEWLPDDDYDEPESMFEEQYENAQFEGAEP